MHILNYILNMSDIYLRYEQLVRILEISPTNDFYEISVPVTLPSRCGIYLQYPKISRGYEPIVHISGIYQQFTEICLVYDMSCVHISGIWRFILVICQVYNYNGIHQAADAAEQDTAPFPLLRQQSHRLVLSGLLLSWLNCLCIEAIYPCACAHCLCCWKTPAFLGLHRRNKHTASR